MVNKQRVFTAIIFFQLLAVLAICFNHLSITLFRGIPEFFSPKTYAFFGVFAIVFLFFSSGFLTQQVNLQFAKASPQVSSLHYVIARYWRLALPIFFGVLFDYFIESTQDLTQSLNVQRALPFVITLTHTWYYKALGISSLGLPFGGANMAWLGSHLFFFAIFFAVTKTFWNKICSPKYLLAALLTCVCVYWGYLRLLELFSPEITQWSADRYGSDLANAYTLNAWLYEYSPYCFIPVFLSGLLTARIIEVATPKTLGKIVIAGLVAFLVFDNSVAYVFLDIAILLLLVRYVAKLPPNTAISKLFEPSGWIHRVSECAYEVFILHLLIFIPNTLNTLPKFSFLNNFLLVGGVFMMTVLTILLCLGFKTFFFKALELRMFKYCGIPITELPSHV